MHLFLTFASLIPLGLKIWKIFLSFWFMGAPALGSTPSLLSPIPAFFLWIPGYLFSSPSQVVILWCYGRICCSCCCYQTKKFVIHILTVLLISFATLHSWQSSILWKCSIFVSLFTSVANPVKELMKILLLSHVHPPGLFPNGSTFPMAHFLLDVLTQFIRSNIKGFEHQWIRSLSRLQGWAKTVWTSVT